MCQRRGDRGDDMITVSKVPSRYPRPCNDKSALPQELKSPQMDKALDFTLLKEAESAWGAMKSIDPSLNGFVRGFRLANHA
ncbi:hypothetical protein EYF80_006576 [Liparis tanakae]|uniref:Uncharacterized protein n=1 Tax=Liparis tanakae TaxID=230148 RepID=A0A4Z2J1B4_9TELE|nr:hypothetical protein EYF80_006576 [Liparis tanakae]